MLGSTLAGGDAEIGVKRHPSCSGCPPSVPGLRDFPGHRTWVLELGKSRPTRWIVILGNASWAGAGSEGNSLFIKGRVPERWYMGG